MLRPKPKDKRAKQPASSASSRPDRRTTRGVLYENEAMRIRAFDMASEVEQRSGDMRRLRRENERLKQQVCCVREEYTRLDQFVRELEELAATTTTTTSVTAASNLVTQPPVDGNGDSPLDLVRLFLSAEHLHLDRLLDIVNSFHDEKSKRCFLHRNIPHEEKADNGQTDNGWSSDGFASAVDYNSVPHDIPDLVGTEKTSGKISLYNRASTTRTNQPPKHNTSSGITSCARENVMSSDADNTAIRTGFEPSTVFFNVEKVECLRDLSVYEVVDALDGQFGSRVSISSVRSDRHCFFITCENAASVDVLESDGLRLRGELIQLTNILAHSRVVSLMGVPSFVTDENLFSLMATFGTVIGGIDRRYHKGIDTGIRCFRIHVRPGTCIPSRISLGGDSFCLHFCDGVVCNCEAGNDVLKTLPSLDVNSSIDHHRANNSELAPFSLADSVVPVDSFKLDNINSQLPSMHSFLHAGSSVEDRDTSGLPSAREETHAKRRIKPFVRGNFKSNSKDDDSLAAHLSSNSALKSCLHFHSSPPPSYLSHMPPISLSRQCSPERLAKDTKYRNGTNGKYSSDFCKDTRGSSGSTKRRKAPDPPPLTSEKSTLVNGRAIIHRPTVGVSASAGAGDSGQQSLDPLRAKLAQCEQIRRTSQLLDRVGAGADDWDERSVGDQGDGGSRRWSEAIVSEDSSRTSRSQAAGSQDTADLPWCGCWGTGCF